MSFGIDIYRYQTVTNYATVRDVGGVEWSYVKLTDGNGRAIVHGDSQVGGLKSAGIPVGGYHYAQFGDPIRQANVFTAELRRLKATDIPPALDLEYPFSPNATAKNFAIRFLKQMQKNGFKRVAVYMNSSFAGSLRPDRWGIPNLVIWIANYSNNISRYYPGRVDIHQYSQYGRVSGISGNVDLNRAYVDMTTKTTVEKEGFLMALTDQQQADIHWRIMNHLPAWVDQIKQEVNEHKPFLVQEVGKPAVYVADGSYVSYRRVRDSVELGHLKARLGEVVTYQAGTLGVLGVFLPDTENPWTESE